MRAIDACVAGRRRARAKTSSDVHFDVRMQCRLLSLSMVNVKMGLTAHLRRTARVFCPLPPTMESNRIVTGYLTGNK